MTHCTGRFVGSGMFWTTCWQAPDPKELQSWRIAAASSHLLGMPPIFVELMEESGMVDWSRCWSLHLYNSQTKLLSFYFHAVVSVRYSCLSEALTECRIEPRRFTRDPVELCRDSSYKSGDLCNGLRLAVEALSHMAAINQHQHHTAALCASKHVKDMDDIYSMVGRGYPVMTSTWAGTCKPRVYDLSGRAITNRLRGMGD